MNSTCFQFLVDDGDLDNRADVPPRFDGDRVTWQIDTQDLSGFSFDAQSLVVFVGIPVFKVNDHVQLFRVSDRSGTVHAADIDDSDPPDFHVIGDRGMTFADQLRQLASPDQDQVIGDECVSPLDQFECTLAFSD